MDVYRVDELQQQEAEIRAEMEAAGNDKHKVYLHLPAATRSSAAAGCFMRLGWCKVMTKQHK